MKHLSSLNKYFWKYKWLFLMGMVFIVLSNYFRILTPQITKYVLNTVETSIKKEPTSADREIRTNYDPIVKDLFI
ncbi:MAG: ABC transporter, partial [Ginsengibacter sp.]